MTSFSAIGAPSSGPRGAPAPLRLARGRERLLAHDRQIRADLAVERADSRQIVLRDGGRREFAAPVGIGQLVDGPVHHSSMIRGTRKSSPLRPAGWGGAR